MGVCLWPSAQYSSCISLTPVMHSTISKWTHQINLTQRTLFKGVEYSYNYKSWSGDVNICLSGPFCYVQVYIISVLISIKITGESVICVCMLITLVM